MIKEQEKQNTLNKLKEIGYEFDNYCLFIRNKELWEKVNFQNDIWYLIIYHRFEEVTYLEINFKEKTFRKYIEHNNYREAMCPEEEYCEKIDMALIDEEEEIFYQLGWIEETTKQRKEQEEQKIFKEFEELDLGYKIFHSVGFFGKMLTIEKHNLVITIYKDMKIYEITQRNVRDGLNMKEHQLLHRLLKLWGWFDE